MTTNDEEIKAEYLQLQNVVEDFDKRAITIKSWSVTLSMAGVGFGYAEEKIPLIFLAACTSLLFWIIEALWKSHQQHFYPRIYEIEECMRTQQSQPPFQIATKWLESYNSNKPNLFSIIFWPHVALPHAPVFMGGILGGLLLLLG